MTTTASPLIVHLIYQLDVGGLENGLVNVINHLGGGYRHTIVCLRGSSSFKDRLTDGGVRVVNLNVTTPWWHRQFWRVLRDQKPDVVHTRNLPTLEGQLVAAAAGVRVRIHGEHGRDVYDLAGTVRRYRWLRRAVNPVIHRFVSVSADLRDWLVNDVGIAASKVALITNGVDTVRFRPSQRDRTTWPEGFRDPGLVVFGTVGRMVAVKSQSTLVSAFCEMLRSDPGLRDRMRLVIVGDGPDRPECERLLRLGGATALAWLPGSRDDVPQLMQNFDVFVLPSQAEGMSNTLLEAMACGLPAIASNVGGNPELVLHRVTGQLVEPNTVAALAEAMRAYLLQPLVRKEHGNNARARVQAHFNLDYMVAQYRSLYDGLCVPNRSSNTLCAESQASSTHAPVA